MPWFQSHDVKIGSNLGDYGNTNASVLALTLYYEDTKASVGEDEAMAQVISNRWNLINSSNSAFAHSLFGNIGTTMIDVAENTSTAWSHRNLRSQANLETLLYTEVVGASSAVGASACNGLLQAMNVSWDTLSKIFAVSPITHYTVGNLSTGTYSFYNIGTKNPVNVNAWNTTFWNLGPFTFENYISPRASSLGSTPGGGRRGGGKKGHSPNQMLPKGPPQA